MSIERKMDSKTIAHLSEALSSSQKRMCVNGIKEAPNILFGGKKKLANDT